MQSAHRAQDRRDSIHSSTQVPGRLKSALVKTPDLETGELSSNTIGHILA